jgi:phage-related protein
MSMNASRLSLVCAACHDRCAQIVHIDGFFKMRRMKRAKSYHAPKLRFFCRVGKETVDGFCLIDLQNKDEDVAMCEDLAGNLTEFRVGDGQQQVESVGYSQTGILTAVGPHRVACAIIPMETKGEKFFMLHAMLDFFEGGNYSGSVDFYSYNIACHLKSYLQIRDPALHIRMGPKLFLGCFHSKSHRCHRWNVGYAKVGSGYNDGEQGKCLNKLMLKYTSFLQYMREEHMKEMLEDFLMCHTQQANVTTF